MKLGKKLAMLSRKIYSKPVYNEKFLKTKVKSCNEKIITIFHNNSIPKEGSRYICLSVILIDSVHRKNNIILKYF